MLTQLAISPLNQLLRANEWALDALREHAGKTALLRALPFELKLTVTTRGDLATADAAANPDVTLTVSAGVLLRLLAHDESAAREVAVSGDMGFAATIDHVRRNLRWDYEEDLSRFFGDAAAHRLAAGVGAFDRWARSTLRNVSESVGEYAMHEQPLVASGPAVEGYSREVDEVRDQVARLEKRLELLRARLAQNQPHGD